MKKEGHTKGLKLIIDAVLLSISLVFIYYLFFGQLPSVRGVSVYIFASLASFYFFGLYKLKDTSFSEAAKDVIKASTLISLLALAYLFYIGSFSQMPFVVVLWISNSLLLAGWRILLRRVRYFEPFVSKVLIIGIGKDEQFVVNELQKHHNFKIVGFVGHSKKKEIDGVPVLGPLKNIRRIIKTNEINEIIFANPKLDHEELIKIVELCKGTNVKFKAIPELYERLMKDVVEEKIDYFPLVDVVVNPIPKFDMIIKRFVDVVASLILIVILSPIFLLIALAIKLDSPGPVFYHQERIGKAGKPFMIHKFRSMIPNAELGTGPVWAKKQDPRETRVGRFLRSRSIDELPNLFNVLKGEMTLVGPRAERTFFVKKFDKYVKHWNERLEITPGLTGLAEVKGDYELTPKQKLRYDMQYIGNYSLWSDVKILLQTVWMELFKNRNY